MIQQRLELQTPHPYFNDLMTREDGYKAKLETSRLDELVRELKKDMNWIYIILGGQFIFNIIILVLLGR